MTVVDYEAAGTLRPLAEKVLVQRLGKRRESTLALDHVESAYHPICRVVAAGGPPTDWDPRYPYPDIVPGDLALVDVYEGDEVQAAPGAAEHMMVSVWACLATLRPTPKGHKLAAVGDRLWVVPEEAAEVRSASGKVIIPQIARLPSQVARVRSVGPGAYGLDGRWHTSPVPMDARVLITSKAGKRCTTGAQTFVLIRYDEALGVMGDDPGGPAGG